MELLRNSLITSTQPYAEGAVYVFEQPFEITEEGKLTVTALGVYEAEVDGIKLGTQLFAPGFTYYPTGLYYQTYDLSYLEPGKHTLRVYLAQGWYCGRFTFDNKVQIYGEKAAVSWALEAGERVYTSADDSVVELESPYEYAGFYDGEIYHSKELTVIGKPVKSATSLPEHISETTCAVRIREEMPVKSITVNGDTTIIDFGQNFAGIVCIDPARMKGESLNLRHGEILNSDGTLYTANLRKAKAETVYHKGNSTESYRPRFTYMGFRYVELTGVPYEEGLLKAYAIYSDMERTGYFQCENPLVQRLYENQIWGQKSNYVEVPTDCPQRDERMGYTGDGQVFAHTGAYNYDTQIFWDKFFKDIRHSQSANKEGYVAPTIPASPGEQGIGFMSMLGWGNCICIVPELLYHHFGTDRFIRENYDAMKTFVDCEIRHMGQGILGKKDLWIQPSLGDWLAMGRDVGYMAMHNGPVSNAFIVNDLRIMAWAAKLLEKTEEAEKYAAQLEKSRDAYIKAFVRSNGKMKDDYQGAYVMALQMVIPKGELWNKVFSHLVSDIKKNGMQTGFFATEHILPLLTENGEEKLVFDLLLSEKCPGWLYQVKAGATTTWERWDALRPDGTVNETKMSNDNMVSFNHYSFGSVGKFYYQYILGIQPLEPGFAKVKIAPHFDERIGPFSGSYKDIKVKWDGEDLHVTTPVEAEIHFPGAKVQTVKPGSYRIYKKVKTMKFPKDFLLGAATAAHQVEGNNIHSDYWTMEQMKSTSFVEPSGDAVDHYNRYEEDIKLLANAGLNAYRFSIEWARIEPEEGKFDASELEHYRSVIRCCKENGVEPIVTLHHFTSPKWLISKGGWESEATVEYFKRYCVYIAENLGSELNYVVTINEANMGLQLAAIAKRYMKQLLLPKKKKETDGQAQVGINLKQMLANQRIATAENVEVFGCEKLHTFVSQRSVEGDLLIMSAHCTARDSMKAICPHLKVGLSLSLHDLQPEKGGEKHAAKQWHLEFGHYLPYIKDDDFLGIQNYSRERFGRFGHIDPPADAELTQMNYEFYPEAIANVLRAVHKEFRGDLIVTENGTAMTDDARRVEFIRRATDGVAKCIADGVPVKGYCYWSLLDNFEWQKGFSMTFGLIAVDRKTQTRFPKESLHYLGKLWQK